MRQILALIVFIGSIVLGVYAGVWQMFIHPIIEACMYFDAGTLTGTIIGITVLKCIFASAVSSIIIHVGAVIATILNK